MFDRFTIYIYYQSGILRVDSMPTDELIATIDATWAGVVTWFEGHSLAQTVTSCSSKM
jgi:hypothetical protein